MSTSGLPSEPPDWWPADKIWPPGRQSLGDAFDKLRWAEAHYEPLRVEVEAFEQRDTHRISCEVDADAGKYTFYVHDLEEPRSDDWGLRIGDCLHNARTALDYLIVRLFSLVTGDKPYLVPRVEFPIFDDPARFEPKGKSTVPSVTEMRKHPTFRGYLARIEELQPFNRGNPSIWGTEPNVPGMAVGVYPRPVQHELPTALNSLSLLDNLDKHRVIHAAWVGAKTPENMVDPPFVPADFKLRGSHLYNGPLKNDTQIASMHFATPLPHDWEPGEVDMKRQFALQVSIYDERRFAGRVLEVLPACLWGVDAVLTIFQPVFDQPAKPPLPVTAIPNRA